MNGRSIFDITDQNFGRLDETIQVANDNSFSLNEEVTEDLIIGDYEGDVKKKDAISLQGFTFNNVFEEPDFQPITEIKGVVAFDGIDDYITLSSIPDTTGTKTISFWTYLTKSSGFSFNVLMNFTLVPNASDRFTVWLNGSDISVNLEAASSLAYDISGLENQFLFIEIDKTQDGSGNGEMLDFRINGISQSSSPSGTTWGTQGATIGADSTPSSYLADAFVWNINVNNERNFPGQPNGNQNSAWADTIGSITATVNGNPTTIDIP